MPKTRVLLVDDEPDIVRTMEYRLEASGYDVVTAANGVEALEKMRREPVQLVLADFMMPEMNGLELTRMIKSHPSWFNTKILLFSCNTDPEFRRRAIEMGALDYLPKTLGANALVEHVYETVPPETHSPTGAGGHGSEEELRLQLASLAQSLLDLLHLAEKGGELPETTAYALESARRIGEDIRKLGGEAG